MKIVSLAFFLITALLSLLLGPSGILLPVIFEASFGAYGIARSFARHVDPLNDIPNAFRVLLASLGGYLVTLSSVYIFPSLGIILLTGAIYLNDEFQRRALYALRTGRRGGSVALLGIDGSGKSSHAAVTGEWLEERGYRCRVTPFHRYLFVDRLAGIFTGVRGSGERGDGYRFRRSGNPLRPVASLLDNLILQLSSSLGCRLEGRIVIYDRFIWSTYVKYKALGYPVRAIAGLYLSPKPTFALVLDVPVEKSLRVIGERAAHIHYPGEVLESEREQYLGIARRNGYPVIDATLPFDEVQAMIEARLQSLFPRVKSKERPG